MIHFHRLTTKVGGLSLALVLSLFASPALAIFEGYEVSSAESELSVDLRQKIEKATLRVSIRTGSFEVEQGTAVAVGPRHILTADHVANKLGLNRYVFRDSRHQDLNVQVAKLRSLAGNQRIKLNKDIVLIETDQDLPSHVEFIELPDKKYSLNDFEKVIAAGYGRIFDKEKNAIFTVRPLKAMTLLPSAFTKDLDSSRLEASTHGQSVCNGDSGGPLFGINKQNIVLIGITHGSSLKSCTSKESANQNVWTSVIRHLSELRDGFGMERVDFGELPSLAGDEAFELKPADEVDQEWVSDLQFVCDRYSSSGQWRISGTKYTCLPNDAVACGEVSIGTHGTPGKTFWAADAGVCLDQPTCSEDISRLCESKSPSACVEELIQQVKLLKPECGLHISESL